MEELEWFADEIDEQFLEKKTYTQEDVDHANLILNAMKERMSVIKDRALERSLTKAIEKIEKIYPEFFNPKFWLS